MARDFKILNLTLYTTILHLSCMILAPDSNENLRMYGWQKRRWAIISSPHWQLLNYLLRIIGLE